MDYNLAKELKEDGFPQSVGTAYGFHDGLETGELVDERNTSVDYDYFAYVPTLSELIEACGGRFHALQRYDSNNWIAYSNESNDLGIEAHIYKVGETPEGVVAKLWLALKSHIK